MPVAEPPYLPTGCAEPDRAQLDAFWRDACRALPDAALPDTYEVRWIGLDDETTRQVIELIEIGDKTGTFTLPWLVERTDQPVPAVGATIILVDFAGAPRLTVRLTAIELVNFGAITAAHTAIDGTPVRDLGVWIPLHTRYWNGLLAPHGLTVAADMPVWIERFELLYAP
ncbi:MAG: ASCH domain-containing protein [Gammaproteobacteria bacterium]